MFFEPSKLLRGSSAVVALGLAIVCGCARPTDPAGGTGPVADGRPRVVCTTTVVADLVRQIAGDRVVVACLMPPGVDPHSYRATPRDADLLAGADLVVASGLRLEGKLADLLDRLGSRVPVLAVADGLPRESLLAVGADAHDPHVWFDAALWARCAPAVAEALARIDPAGAALHRERAAAHAAFRYFGRAYGIEVVGVQGTSTESEAGIGDVNRLVDLLVERRIPAVFVETSVADRNVTALVEGAAARGHTVALGGRLYSDSLGGPESGADTLEAALLANVRTIVAALAPAGPTVPP